MLAKVQDWLEGGCRCVWVVDPRTRSITAYRSLNEISVLREECVVTDDELLPAGREGPAGSRFTFIPSPHPQRKTGWTG